MPGRGIPPSMGPLHEYSYHIAREIRRHEDVELIIIADEMAMIPPLLVFKLVRRRKRSPDLPNVKIIRCWKVDSWPTRHES